jgi:transposase-like protein
MSTIEQRKQYSREFKEEAIRLAAESKRKKWISRRFGGQLEYAPPLGTPAAATLV